MRSISTDEIKKSYEFLGMDESISSSIPSLQHNVMIHLEHDKIIEFEKIDINFYETIYDIIKNEVSTFVQKEICDFAFNSSPIKEIDDDVNYYNHSLLAFVDDEVLKNSTNAFIITNGCSASVMQNHKNFSCAIVNHMLRLNNAGALYTIGKIGNIQVAVNPYMRWDDNRVAVIYNNFYDFSFEMRPSQEIESEIQSVRSTNGFSKTICVGVISVKFSDVKTNLIKVNNLSF